MQTPLHTLGESAPPLQGWKEIAAHLGVTVRTAQAWEKDRGLPVQRMPGKRSIVYCDTTELEAWRGLGGPAKQSEVRRSYWTVLAAAVAGLGVAGVLAWKLDDASQQTALLQAAPLTSSRDYEGRPDLSPDASQIAYLASGQSGAASVRIMDLQKHSTSILAADALEESAVRWSPGGDRLAYVRRGEEGLEIIEIDPLEGGARVIASLGGADRAVNLIDNAVFDWGEPGLALSAREGSGPFFIALASPQGGEVRRITNPPENYGGDSMPAFSRDGRSIAFARFSSLSECALYVVDLETGREQLLIDETTRIWGFDWLPDGSLIYASSVDLGHPSLRRVDLTGKTSPPVTGPEYSAHFPNIAVDGDGKIVLVYQKKERWSSIRSAVANSESNPQSVVESTWLEAWPDLSPDGQRLTFTSTRSGATEVWVAGAELGDDGPTRLTCRNGPYSDMPRWSPDGSKISFTSADESGNRDVYLIDVATQKTTRFTTGPSEEGRASWSRDGRWIYFRSDRSGSRQIWKQRSDGSAPAIQVTMQGGYEAFESFDGGTLYYVRSRLEDELWSIRTAGGDERMVIAGPGEGRWRIAAEGVVFRQHSQLLFWNATQDTVTKAFDIPPYHDPHYGFVVSPDLGALWWAQSDRNGSDLWLAEW